MLMTTENGIRLSYNDCGDGPPVLLLTGTVRRVRCGTSIRYPRSAPPVSG